MTIADRLVTRRILAGGLFMAALLAGLPAATAASPGAPHQVADIAPGGPYHGGQAVSDMLSLPTATLILTETVHELPGGYPLRLESGLWATDGTAARTRLLRVWSTTEWEAQSRMVTVLGNRAILQPPGTYSLWVSDGTREGTRRLVPSRLQVALLDTQPWTSLPTIKGRLVFVGCYSTWQCSLWATDGNPKHTRSLGIPWYGIDWDFIQHARFGDRLFLEVGSRIYATDGTRAGTTVLVDFGSDAQPRELVATRDALYFFRGEQDSELWRSDGTPEGTARVQTFPRRSFWYWPALHLTAAAHRVYFSLAGYGTTQYALATSDGTPDGARRLTAPTPSNDGYSYLPLGTFGDRLLYAQRRGGELRTSDGRKATTRRLEGCPGGCPTYHGFILGELRGQLLFLGEQAGEVDVWVTDGSGPGTRRIASTCAARCNGSPIPITSHRGRFYWWRYTYEGAEVWSTDLTPGGTRKLLPTAPGSIFEVSGWGILPDGELLLSGPDLEGRGHFWRIVGSSTQAVELPLPVGASPSSDPSGFTAVPTSGGAAGTRFVFAACDGEHQTAYGSDGTAAGTEALSEPSALCWEEPAVGSFVTLGEAVYYLDSGRLMRTDGTPAGTALVFDTGTGVRALDNGASVTRLGDRLVVLANEEGEELTAKAWVSDGTAEGTHPLIQEGLFEIGLPIVAGRQLFFAASDYCDDEGCWPDLYRTDGTPEGTRAVLDDPAHSIYSTEMAVRGDELYLLADDGLWRTDGTPAGTRRVLPAAGGPPLNLVHDLAATADAVYFFSAPPDQPWDEGVETLYRTDGTAAGTVGLVTQPVAQPDAVSHREPTVLGGRLFFRGSDEAHGEELWSTDGTRAGTALVVDLAPGPASSTPHHLRALGGRLVFAAEDGLTGIEPWWSDGTAAGTVRLGDLAPGGFSSWPSDFAVAGDLLLFAADDAESGSEPWAVER